MFVSIPKPVLRNAVIESILKYQRHGIVINKEQNKIPYKTFFFPCGRVKIKLIKGIKIKTRIYTRDVESTFAKIKEIPISLFHSLSEKSIIKAQQSQTAILAIFRMIPKSSLKPRANQDKIFAIDGPYI